MRDDPRIEALEAALKSVHRNHETRADVIWAACDLLDVLEPERLDAILEAGFAEWYAPPAGTCLPPMPAGAAPYLDSRARPPCDCGSWSRWLRHVPVEEGARRSHDAALRRIYKHRARCWGCPVKGWLLTRNGEDAGDIVPLRCARLLEDEEGERCHVRYEGGRFLAEASAGSTPRDGVGAEPVVLEEYDEIRVGEVSYRFRTTPIDVLRVCTDSLEARDVRFEGRSVSVGPAERGCDVVLKHASDSRHIELVGRADGRFIARVLSDYSSGHQTFAVPVTRRVDTPVPDVYAGHISCWVERWPHAGPKIASRVPTSEATRIALEEVRGFLGEQPPSSALFEAVLDRAWSARADASALVLDYLLQHAAAWEPPLGRPSCPCGSLRRWVEQMPATRKAQQDWLWDVQQPEGLTETQLEREPGCWRGCAPRGYLLEDGWNPAHPERCLPLRCAQRIVFTPEGKLAVRAMSFEPRDVEGDMVVKVDRDGVATLFTPAAEETSPLRHDGRVRIGERGYTFYTHGLPGTLRITEPSGEVERFHINAPEVIFGRQSDCAIQRRDSSVSRQHCAFEYVKAEDAYYVRDFASTSGIYVNSSRVTRHRLREGDKVWAGQYTFELLGLDGPQGG